MFVPLAAARRLVASRATVTRFALRTFVAASRPVSATDNITYSGGQATEGQGGFYGSGGARVIQSSDVDSEGRQAIVAYAADVELISAVMDEVYKLEMELENEDGGVTTKAIELKASIKKLMTAPEVTEALDRLEVKGDLVWGLSTDEREMILLAREKMNSV